MRFFSLLSILFLFSACGSVQEGSTSASSSTKSSAKPVAEKAPDSKPITETPEEEDVAYIPMQGVVHLKSKGCENLIEMKTGASSLWLYPVNLDKAYQTEGREVTFTYKKIETPAPEGCSVDMTIRIVSIE